MDLPERKDILKLHDRVYDFMTVVNQTCVENKPELLVDAVTTGEEITKHAKSLYKKQDLRDPIDQLTPFVSTSYWRQVTAYRRVRDHLINIVEVVKGEK
jgi:hypothetical protein